MTQVPLSIGLTGAQRTGKSTLARAYADYAGIKFLPTQASAVFAELGLDPKLDYGIGTRLLVQEAILSRMEADYALASAEGSFIADRTPLDLAAYMLADVQRSTFTPGSGVGALVNDYIERCLMSAGRWFSLIFLVQPGIKAVEAEGKAPACPVFMEHMNAIIGGLMMDKRVGGVYRIDRTITDPVRRLRVLDGAIENAVEKAEELAKTIVKH